ncbi:MAG: RsmG family class I SAM-dependent methyltransferase [Candidatus Limnocylindrus sp.]
MLDSLVAAPHIERLLPRGGKIADLGSGGGFPGVPLAARLLTHDESLSMTLIESIGKKARFLEVVTRTRRVPSSGLTSIWATSIALCPIKDAAALSSASHESPARFHASSEPVGVNSGVASRISSPSGAPARAVMTSNRTPLPWANSSARA